MESAEIDGTAYRLKTTADGTIPDGSLSAKIKAKAEKAGKAYNLGEGYYSILASSVSGIARVKNESGWLTKPGTDLESDESLRLRCRNRMLKVSDHFTNGVYKSIIARRTGAPAENIHFDLTAPHGPFTANAYIMLEVGDPSQTFLDDINRYIDEEGHHGHNDDLRCYALPRVEVSVSATAVPTENLTDAEKSALLEGVRNMIKAAFRQSAAYPRVTRVEPHSLFSPTRLAGEMYAELPHLRSIAFTAPTGDIESGLNLPKLAAEPAVRLAT